MGDTNVRQQDVKAFCNSRATLAEAAGSVDLIAKQLEMAAIGRYVRDGMRVLHAGCGNGVTAIDLASRHTIEVVGFDFVPAMVEAAREPARLADDVAAGLARTRPLPPMADGSSAVLRALVSFAAEARRT